MTGVDERLAAALVADGYDPPPYVGQVRGARLPFLIGRAAPAVCTRCRWLIVLGCE